MQKNAFLQEKDLKKSHGFAGGGSQPFNHFLAELATGQICSQLTLLTVLGLSQVLDFAAQNLGVFWVRGGPVVETLGALLCVRTWG